nr:ABC transporter ATP-binding protein [Hyphomonas sp. Mor2]
MASIELKSVSVEYPLYGAGVSAAFEENPSAPIGGELKREGTKTIRALDGISLSLRDGDRLGILGSNGAGKTTLLKTLAGILPPVTGEIRTEGVISPLTSIMLGLDGEATGFDNIRIRGRFMGYSEDEITDIIPEVAEFTELGEFLNLPIKTYSSGMRMRLSLATSTAFQPDILLLDEWLGTGDVAFRDKAARRLRQLIFDSGIFVFASHSRDMHQRLSNKGLVLRKGRLLFFGDIDEAFDFQDEQRAKEEENREQRGQPSTN